MAELLHFTLIGGSPVLGAMVLYQLYMLGRGR